MIRLLPTNQNFTPVPDSFILHSMAKMSSTVIKIYLFLLYQFHQQYETLELDEIADTLQVTESDVFRAIKHLAKANLLLCQMDGEQYTEISLPCATPKESMHKSSPKTSISKSAETDVSIPSPLQGNNYSIEKKSVDSAPASTATDSPIKSVDSTLSGLTQESSIKSKERLHARPSYSATTLEQFAKDASGDQLIFFTQALFQKNLTTNDLQILFGLHDWLGMSYDLIQFLIEYCAENHHTKMNYIEKVAINWHENHIETIEQAKDYLASYPSHYYTVLKAYGIYNLAPIPAQIKMIDKWVKEYLFPMETIVYACEKTILQTGKPELNYTDSILKSWKSKNLLTKEQVLKAEADAPKKSYPKDKTDSGKATAGKATTFTNYEQRKEDYDAIEKRALEMRIKKKESQQ